MPTYGQQWSLDGERVFTSPDGSRSNPTALTDKEKVALIMDRYPETRDCDKLLLFFYWKLFGPLDRFLNPEAQDSLLRFLACKETKVPESVRRRRQELHKLRTEEGILRPAPDILDRRRRLDRSKPDA